MYPSTLKSDQYLNRLIILRWLPPGFTITESSYSQPQFSTVQQLQDSSTLESQALSSSYHPPNLLHVSSAEVVSRWPPCVSSAFTYIHQDCNS